MSKSVVSLRNRLPIPEIGGKAHSLCVLLNNGFNVPQGVVVRSSAFFDFLEYNDLAKGIHKLALEITQDNFKEKSAYVREEILKGRIPGDIISEIEKFLNKLGAKYVAIRSSGAIEDSLKSSFAGLFDTFLNIRVESSLVLENMIKCWASLFNERVVIYRIRKSMPQLEGMAVIIQEMVPADISGITFSVHPLNEKTLLIEASYGLGDLIVGGKIDPDTIVVDRKTHKILEIKIGCKSKMSVCDDSGLKVIDVPQELAHKLALHSNKVKEIVDISLKVEEIFNTPQDIEWCISNERIWLLQSRAITALVKE